MQTVLTRIRNAWRALFGKPPISTDGGGGPRPVIRDVPADKQ